MAIKKLILANVTKNGETSILGGIRGGEVMVTNLITKETGSIYGFNTEGTDIVDGKCVIAMSSSKDSGKITTIKPSDLAAHCDRSDKMIAESADEINIFKRLM